MKQPAVSSKADKEKEKNDYADTNPKKPSKQRQKASVNRFIHSLLQSAYTLHPNCPQFENGTVLDENLGVHPPGAGTSRDSYYLVSCFSRFVYLMISLSRTAFGGVAFMNCCCLFLFDYIHAQLEHGKNDWSPYHKVVLLLVGRMTIMSSSGHRWLLTYSLAYVAYSYALSTASLPSMEGLNRTSGQRKRSLPRVMTLPSGSS